MMTGKEWVDQVTEVLETKLNRIERDEERVRKLENDIWGVTAIVYDLDKVQTSCDGDILGRKFAEIEELNQMILRRMEDYARYRADVIKKVDKYIPNPDLSVVIRDRHIFFMSNSQISDELGITDRAVRKRFFKAYELLNSIYILEKYRKKTKSVDSSAQKVVI